MKRLTLALLVLFTGLSSFQNFSCFKHHPTSSNIQVDITFDEATEVVTFTGEQGQGTFTFDPNNTSHSMPATGTYQICATWGGGNGGFRVSIPNGPNLVLVGSQGGTNCGSGGYTLVPEYNAWVQGE